MAMLNNQRVIRCNNHPNRGVLMLTCTMATCDSPSDGRDPWWANKHLQITIQWSRARDRNGRCCA